MHGFIAFLVLLVTLPLTLLAALIGFAAFVVKLAFTFGLDAARWVLDPYPSDPTEVDKEDDDSPPVIFSPRTAAEVLADVAKRNADPVVTFDAPAAQVAAAKYLDQVPMADLRNASPPGPTHIHSFDRTNDGGAICHTCGFDISKPKPPTPDHNHSFTPLPDGSNVVCTVPGCGFSPQETLKR